MMRLIAFAFALTLASFAQAMPLAPLHQPDQMVTTVREACGAGMHMVNGTCVRTTPAVRQQVRPRGDLLVGRFGWRYSAAKPV